MMRPIDADALKKSLALQEESGRMGKLLTVVIHSVIDSMPTIEERKKGKWKKEDQYTDKWGDRIEILRCSICEFKHNYVLGDTSHRDTGWFNFCPNCGARMIQEGEQL